MTRAEWAKRKRTTVTFTREELERLGRLITAGRAVLADDRSFPQLKAAMSRLQIKLVKMV
jgi:hypothetical protein